MDFDRGFSSGFSPPDIFCPFSVFGHAHKVSKSVTKSVFCHRKTQNKKSATKSVAKSVPLGRKIHRKIRHSHLKNPPQFHSAETCALSIGRLGSIQSVRVKEVPFGNLVWQPCIGPSKHSHGKSFWPGPSAEMCRGFLLCKFWRILPGIFLEDFSGTFSHKNEEKKSGEKIREKIRRPKTKNPRKIRSAKNRP